MLIVIFVSLIFFFFFFEFLYATRSGEWGDHVTLQAAADRVSGSFVGHFFFPAQVNIPW